VNPQPICVGCGTPTTIFKPVCDECLRAVGEVPITCVFCLVGRYSVRQGLHYAGDGGYVGKCTDDVIAESLA
jgi:hypothetical protein